jgi:aspartyl-tRNA(Asn)/glutamyl-tRNA(Gln) amidotransferase subunit B
LSEYDAYNLTDSKQIALYFEEVIQHTPHFKSAANWVMGEVKSYLNEQGKEIEDFPLEASRLAGIIELIHQGNISHTMASQKLFPAMLKETGTAIELATALDLLQTNDTNTAYQFIEKVMNENPNEVVRYKNGEKQLVGFFMGQFMKVSGGKVDPKSANELIRKALES